VVDSSWNWRMEWVASNLRTTSEHVVYSITTADAHTSAASSRLNWRPRRFKLTRPFRRKTKSGFCACAITFRTQSNCWWKWPWHVLRCYPKFFLEVRWTKKKEIAIIVDGVYDGIRTHDLKNTEQQGWPVQGEIRYSVKVKHFAGIFV